MNHVDYVVDRVMIGMYPHERVTCWCHTGAGRSVESPVDDR